MIKKLVLTLLVIFAPACLSAQERITSFKSHITIHENASMTVQETISVVATGNKIKRGIFRDLPTTYKDRFNNTISIGFEIKSVTRNSHHEPYTVKNLANGKRIYIGSDKSFLRPGLHIYTITYHTNRQLGFFKDFDELYWNVTGNGWLFTIEKASVTVTLPKATTMNKITIEGYTGHQGSKGQDYRSTVINTHSATAHTTQALWPKQGFTIAMTWPKGIVKKPSILTTYYYMVRDNLGLAVCLLLLIALLIFYLMLTIKAYSNRIPYPEVPLFTPPENLLPAHIYHITNMGFGSQALTAEVVNMACQGLLTIHFEQPGLLAKMGLSGKGVYTLKRTQKQTEDALHNKLLACMFNNSETLLLHDKSMISAHKYLQMNCAINGNKYFDDKQNYVAVGGIMFTVAAICLLYYNETQLLALMAAALLIHMPFYFLLKNYTPAGQKLLADINGFKLFLVTTELERIKVIGTPPTKTPELYEKYLPYAIALGVEKQWTNQFGQMFKQMEQQGHAYVPLWYTGTSFAHFRATNFSNTLSRSLSQTMAAASKQAPGTFSGSGGRGSSGGGGGGGGGGGW